MFRTVIRIQTQIHYQLHPKRTSKLLHRFPRRRLRFDACYRSFSSQREGYCRNAIHVHSLRLMLSMRDIPTLPSFDTFRREAVWIGAQICPSHMMATGHLRNVTACQSDGCINAITGSAKGWYSLISEQLAALRKEQNSFMQLMSGCNRAHEAITFGRGEILSDYFDGNYSSDCMVTR